MYSEGKIKPACYQCRYFEKTGGARDGECRYNPPGHYGFPDVDSYQWCAKFEWSINDSKAPMAKPPLDQEEEC